jgi:hypothetical protein
MIGSPGTGKSMLAARLPTILPPLTEAESLETTRIYSDTGRLGGEPLMTRRPFRTTPSATPAGGRRQPAGTGRDQPVAPRRQVPVESFSDLSVFGRAVAGILAVCSKFLSRRKFR